MNSLRFRLVFTVIMATMMVTLLTFVLGPVRTLFAPDWLRLWAIMWLTAWPVAMLAVWFFAPIAQRLAQKIDQN